MRPYKFSLPLILLLTLLGCEKQETKPNLKLTEITGTWANPASVDSLTSYSRIGDLPDNNYAIEFHEDGTMIERKNAGWCGTPPIAYGDFEGTWSAKGDTIRFMVDFWGGTAHITWKLIEVDATTLRIIVLNHETHYREDF